MTDETTYRVVANAEEQYSIWPVDQMVPSGWRELGVVDSKSGCLGYIEQVWTDMRPLSLRARLADDADSAIRSRPKE